MPVYEQPGRTITTDKDGKQILTVTYVGTEEYGDPDLGTIRSKSVTRDVAGVVRTTFQIELDPPSSGPGAPVDGVSVEVVATTRSVPIEAHPNFGEKYLSAEDKKKIKDAVQVPDRSPDFEDTGDRARAISLYGYLLSGITSYYEPSLVVRKTYQASSPPPANRVGKIADPGVSVPGVPSGATFLLISISSRGSAGKYTVTMEYEMSGEGGWDTFLYG